MKFVCLGYIDAAMWESMPKDEAEKAMEACMAYDNELRQGGHFAGGGALSAPQNGVTLHHQDGQVRVTDGPFIETKEQIGGILLLEARDLNHAIQLMSKHPGVRMGPFEIRPADEAMNLLILEMSERLAREAEAKQPSRLPSIAPLIHHHRKDTKHACRAPSRTPLARKPFGRLDYGN